MTKHETHKKQMRAWYWRNREKAIAYMRARRKTTVGRCACGRQATHRKFGDLVCERCYHLEQLREMHDARRAVCGEPMVEAYALRLPHRVVI